MYCLQHLEIFLGRSPGAGKVVEIGLGFTVKREAALEIPVEFISSNTSMNRSTSAPTLIPTIHLFRTVIFNQCTEWTVGVWQRVCWEM